MKNNKFLILLFLLVGFLSCTSDFEEINKNPNDITSDAANPKYLLTGAQYKLYAPSRYTYWRGVLIHADRYSGYFCFGNSGSWWSDELGYKYHSGYTDATWGMYGGYFKYINSYLEVTAEEGGKYQNDKMYAVGLIIKSLFFQQFTDVFGDVPYSETGNTDILQPKYDTQKDIYTGIINDLNEAMAKIGDAEKTGEGEYDLGKNDLIFNGNLQLWKKLANTLKLRVALRAYGASGADFAATAINEAMSGQFLEAGEDAILTKDNSISQWNSASYADIWHRFGGKGSKWKVSQTMIKYLKDNNDPRLPFFAEPAEGGAKTFKRPDASEDPDGYDKFPKRINFIKSVLEDAGAEFEFSMNEDSATFVIPENKYYIGQPTRLGAEIKKYARWEFFSSPKDYIIGLDANSNVIAPELVLTAAESYFLRAQAITLGLASGDANDMYQKGLRASMTYWGASDSDVDNYLATAPMGSLSGDQNSDMEKIAVQRWIAAYTDGFEGWSIVRKTGYPKALSQGVSDIDIFGLGDLNGKYPQRLRYGSSAYSLNGDQLQKAIDRQGPDVQATEVWWAK